jgi:hypothetical protein
LGETFRPALAAAGRNSLFPLFLRSIHRGEEESGKKSREETRQEGCEEGQEVLLQVAQLR